GLRFVFALSPSVVKLSGLPKELTYFEPSWQADPGVTYRLDSVPTLLVRGGSNYYDQATGRAYNPLDPFYGGASYTLTAPDGSRDLIGPHGIYEHDTASGQVLRISGSGITAANGDTLLFIRDGSGRILSAKAPDGQTVDYLYDASGHLAAVVHNARGTLDRYGYDASDGVLSVAVGQSGGQAFLPGQPPLAVALSGDFGTPLEFD